MNKSCLIGFLMCSAFSLVVQAATDGAHITKTISQIERKKGINVLYNIVRMVMILFV